MRSLALGAVGTGFLGRMYQSAGLVSVGIDLNAFAGDYNFAGGSINAGAVVVCSRQADARFTQTGGTLIAAALGLGADKGRSASFSQLAGTANSSALNIGTAFSTAASALVMSGSGARWNNNGATVVGALGAGTLDISNGARAATGTAVIGNAVGSSGLVNVVVAGSSWAVAGLLTVGNVGSGLLTVYEGASVTAGTVVLNGSPVVSGQSPALAAKVAGAGAVLGVNTTLFVGFARGALLHITDGGTVNSPAAVVGDQAGVAGQVLLTGPGALWTSSNFVVVGNRGDGTVNVGANTTLRNASASMGANGNGSGLVVVDGANALWDNPGAVVVGQAGQGRVVVSKDTGTGARWQSGAAFLGQDASGRGEVAVLGATWQNLGTLVVGDGGMGVITVAQGGSFTSPSALLGQAAGGNGRLSVTQPTTRVDILNGLVVGGGGTGRLEIGLAGGVLRATASVGDSLGGSGTALVADAGSLWQNTGALVVGRAGAGTLTVSNGGSVTTASAVLGQLPVGSGTVNVHSAGVLTVNDALSVGGAGRGLLNITSQGSVVVAGLTSVAAGSQIVLDGGTLQSATVALCDPARLDWRAGVLRISGAGAGVALDGLALSSILNLLPGRTLQVDGALVLRPDSTLLLSGGVLAARSIGLNGAVLASTGSGAFALNMDRVGALLGQGQVAAQVLGGGGGDGVPPSLIQANGVLTLGLAGRTDGFDYGGRLLVNEQVIVMDRDLAALGSSTVLFSGAQLASVNGAWLAGGRTLESQGSASVQGAFVNDGAVAARFGGTLSFFDAVSGVGSFTGNVRFLAGYAPGNGVAAQVSFGGGRVSFDDHARLSLNVNVSTPGTGFDQLLNIGTLSFDGTLALAFGSGFSAAPGTQLALLDFNAFEGRLDAAHIVVSGYDVQQLDLSRLAFDGTVTITVVPEPATWALWLAGLAGMRVAGVRFKRARQTPRSA